MYPDLNDLLENLPEHPVISIAGAGGKTTLMFELARKLPGPVVVTTTTKVGEDQILQADLQLTEDDFPPEMKAKVMWVSPLLEPQNGKISGFDADGFSRLVSVCREMGFAVVCEADGAARRHLKAPAAHEPVIPAESSVCIYSAGMDVLGKTLNEQNVHRPEIFSALTGKKPGDCIDSASVLALLDHPEGGLKGMPENSVKIVWLTHTDTPERIRAVRFLTENLKNYNLVCTHDGIQEDL